ncbi:MaoC family dehydratase N-terminal domain-containing protein, partial [Candidatus Bathyarchaeota archaeon]|nr:MaoC family dehydratase N-terminal domain-containing protein [Candidatus Bathyarchaeota archaeon]
MSAIRTPRENVKNYDEFVKDSKKLLGLPVCTGTHAATIIFSDDPIDHQVCRTTADLRNIRQSCYAIGDNNPLYTDPQYGRYTRWGTLIAHPTFVAHLRYNMWRGAQGFGTYASTSLVAGFGWEWFDVIRLGDEFKT